MFRNGHDIPSRVLLIITTELMKRVIFSQASVIRGFSCKELGIDFYSPEE